MTGFKEYTGQAGFLGNPYGGASYEDCYAEGGRRDGGGGIRVLVPEGFAG